ncbi:MAG: hypothetical protein V7L27_25455 [Nostoc sp.]|uniref:hypothetical protein n=1 Tax=Nostoc sp. TaxID=1180 RepID=UPI002FF85337
MSRSQSPTGNAILKALPPLLAAEPPGAVQPEADWKRDFKEIQFRMSNKTLVETAIYRVFVMIYRIF